jgi:hypothetical protein
MFQELTGSMPCCTGERSSLWVMNADGSGARQLVPSLTSDRSGVGVGVGVWGGVWAPDSERIVFAHESGLGVIDVASGALTPSLGIDVDATSWIDRDVDATSWIDRIRWRPDHEQILVTVELAEGGDEAYLVSADGSGLRSLPATATHGSWSPDGSELAYTASAEAGADSPTSIHLLDVDSGIDRELTFDGSQGTDFFGEFSPDGTRLLIWRRTGISDPSCSRPSWCEYSRPFVVPLAGGGPEVRLGSFDAMTVPGEGGGAVFTPDGEQILGMYGKAPKGVWLYDADTGDETAMTGTPWNEGWWGMTWQRLAP